MKTDVFDRLEKFCEERDLSMSAVAEITILRALGDPDNDLPPRLQSKASLVPTK